MSVRLYCKIVVIISVEQWWKKLIHIYQWVTIGRHQSWFELLIMPKTYHFFVLKKKMASNNHGFKLLLLRHVQIGTHLPRRGIWNLNQIGWQTISRINISCSHLNGSNVGRCNFYVWGGGMEGFKIIFWILVFPICLHHEVFNDISTMFLKFPCVHENYFQ